MPHSAAQNGKAGELTLRSSEFRAARESGWRKLDDMVTRVEKGGISVLSDTESEEIALLYRSAVSSLSVARNIALDRNLLLYLENLTFRAYLVVYGPRTGMLRNMAEFFTRTWPAAVRSVWRQMIAAALILFVSAAAGYMIVRADVNDFSLFVPEWASQGRGPDSTREELLNDEIFAPWKGFTEMFVVFANFLFRHNTMVGILCFGLGFMLGVPTMILIAMNGATLGAFVALHADKGLAVDFIGWLSIHGVTEISAILLMGAAGLLLAQNIVFPGRLSRLESLARAGHRAAAVAVGSVVMFFIAGIIEGGFRQLISNTAGRLAFAAVTGLLWVCYFTLAGGGANDDGR
ncbi:MAG: stage II sporulation protein M [Synergistaceae bacterium]|jgi:uncharacterized membrane protein SpoIIM required for sporulation|nr:stage II sporulation protein M [Synergistaceae bacterium]